MKKKSNYTWILSCLGEGKKNAVHLAHLETISNLPNREIRKGIEELRRKGHIIISDTSGYHLPSGKEELMAYIRQEEKRAKSIFFTLKSARELLKKIEQK